MKQITIKTMLLLPCAVIVVMIGITAYFACSADDDWEGSPEYLKTRAPMLTRAGMDVGDDDLSDIQLRNSCVPNGCTIWCLTKIMGQSYANFNTLLAKAAELYSFSIGKNGGSLSPEQTYNIGIAVGISLSGYYNSDTSQGIILSKLDSLKRGNTNMLPSKTIVFKDGHCSLAKSLVGNTININDVNNETTMNTTELNGLVY